MGAPILPRIRAYLRETGMAQTRFGRTVAGDPRLVGDIVNGREPRRALVAKIEAFIATSERPQ